MEILKALEKAREQLKGNVAKPLQEGEKLLSGVLKVSVPEIYLRKRLNQRQVQKFFLKVNQRLKGYPLDHILKESYFYKRRFYIKPGTFIPRQESEELVKRSLKAKPLRGVDLGAGSGCLSISILLENPPCRFVAVDIGSSVKILKRNRQLYGLTRRLKILDCDVLKLEKKDLISFLKGSPDLIVANPPYIKKQDEHLQEEVRFFEPPLALFSAEKGMAHIYSWFEKAMSLLEKGGVYIFEFGFNQGDKVKKFLERQKTDYKIHKDFLGWERVAVCIKREALR